MANRAIDLFREFLGELYYDRPDYKSRKVELKLDERAFINFQKFLQDDLKSCGLIATVEGDTIDVEKVKNYAFAFLRTPEVGQLKISEIDS